MPTITKVKPPPDTLALPDNKLWCNRFEIVGESGRKYIVAQNIKKGHWGCSCQGFLRWRKCKHLTTLGLPCHEKPYFPHSLNEG